jgi:hypothetical protein
MGHVTLPRPEIPVKRRVRRVEGPARCAEGSSSPGERPGYFAAAAAPAVWVANGKVLRGISARACSPSVMV